MHGFEMIWKKIINLPGAEFKTKTGLPFNYRIDGNSLWVTRDGKEINQNFSITNFEQVYGMMEDAPLAGPGEINKRVLNSQYGTTGIKSQVRGTSYVWAILHDNRISGTCR